MEAVAVMLSALAFLFAIYSYARQVGLQRRVTSIEESRREEEVAARMAADLTVVVKRELKKGAWSHEYDETRLVLHNRGPAVARDVDIVLLGVTQGFPELRKGDHFPIRLDAGQEYPLWLVTAWGMSTNIRAALRWEDSRGQQQKTVELSLR
jgi:hypothetical protein